MSDHDAIRNAPDFVWVCNECNSSEYTSNVREDDIEHLACSSCGSDEFHKEEIPMYDKTTEDLISDNKKLKEQLQFVNIASHSLASLLCGVATVSEKDGYELIRRESVMELVMQWQKNWDSAMKVPNTKVRGCATTEPQEER